MTGYERQDERMVEWLERGPWEPPVELLESAAAYARSHPHRVSRFAGLRRSIMSGIRLTPVQRQPAAHRSTYLALAAMAAVVVIAVGLAAFTGLLDGRPEGGPPAGGITSPSPTASVLPEPTQSSQPSDHAVIAGRITCPTMTGYETNAGGILQMRGAVVRCEVTSPDSRVAGRSDFAYNADRPADGAGDAWGTISLVADAGTWDGMWSGTNTAAAYTSDETSFTTQRRTAVLVGSGALEGLRIRLEMRATGGVDIATDWSFDAVLEPVDTIPPDGTTLISGSSSCSAVRPGTEETVDGVIQRRGTILECRGNVGSDPRLDGSGRTTLNGDEQPDGSATMWGTEEIRVGGELRWSGEFAGTVAVGFTTHRLEGTSIGYGPYAGLVYHWTMIGDPSSVYVTSGQIEPAP